MNALDVMVSAVLLLSILIGLLRGLIRTVFGLAGWVIAAIVAVRFGDAAGSVIFAGVHDPSWQSIGGIITLFVIVKLLVSVAGHVTARLIRALGLGGGDRLLGAVFGILRGVALVLVGAIAAGFTSLPQTALWRSSFVGPQLEAAALRIKPFLPYAVASRIRFGTEI